MWLIILVVIVVVGYVIYKHMHSTQPIDKSPKITREYLENMPLKELGELNVHIGNIIMMYRPVYEKVPSRYSEYGCQTWEELINLNKLIGSIYTKRSKKK